MNRFILVLSVFGILVFAVGSFAQEAQRSEVIEEITEENAVPPELGNLMFSVRSYFNTTDEIIENTLYKGEVLYWDAKKDTRYAVVASSPTVDMLLRLSINDLQVYRDLYYGEDAGVLFTPKRDEKISLTVLSSGRIDGSQMARDIFQSRLSESAEDENDAGSENNASTTMSAIKVGDYLVEIYELPSLPEGINAPFSAEQELNIDTRIAHRGSKEFLLPLEQDTRAYVRLSSTEFDTLLEISNRYGQTLISDDWTEGTSLISFEVPTTEDYYLTVTSFDGQREGIYQLEVMTTENKQVGEVIRGQITPSSPKVLEKYSAMHTLDFRSGDFLTVEVQALDDDIEVALVTESLEAVHIDSVYKGVNKKIPLYIPKNSGETYKLIVLNESKSVNNYILTFFE